MFERYSIEKSDFLCADAMLFIVALLFVVWLNFAPIIAYPIQELQYIKISYFGEKNASHREIVVDDVTEKELIYRMLKRAKLVHVDRWAGDECGSDYGWYLWLYFNDAVEGYDSEDREKDAKEFRRKYGDYYSEITTSEKNVRDMNTGSTSRTVIRTG